MTNGPSPLNDPLNLKAVDQQLRINALEEELADMGMKPHAVDPNCPPGVHEQYLSSVLEYDKAPISSHLQTLQRMGLELPTPELLDDRQLHGKLWEVINALASRSAYLYNTDHLSDRELYTHLLSDSLREEIPVFPPGSGWTNHIDLIGSGSEEDIQIGLRYYDSEESRQRWAKEWPKDYIPPHENPPHDRNRFLPKAPPPQGLLEDGDAFDEIDDGGDGV